MKVRFLLFRNGNLVYTLDCAKSRVNHFVAMAIQLGYAVKAVTE